MMKRGKKTQTIFIVYFSIYSLTYIYKKEISQTAPRQAAGLVWRSRDPTMVLFGLFCVCGSPFLLQIFFFFCLFSTSFDFASCFILFIPLQRRARERDSFEKSV